MSKYNIGVKTTMIDNFVVEAENKDEAYTAARMWVSKTLEYAEPYVVDCVEYENGITWYECDFVEAV